MCLLVDLHVCQWCQGKSTDPILNVHHIESRKTGGDGAWYLIKHVRRNNRQLHKATIRKGGKRQRNTAPKYVPGFRLFDGVKYQGTFCFVFGRRSSGYFDLRALDGKRIHASASYKHLKRVQKASAHLIERRSGISSHPVN